MKKAIKQTSDKDLRAYASDNLVNLGKKGKVEYYYDYGVYIGHCPLCNEVAYEDTHCVFCGCEFEELSADDILKIREANHEYTVTCGKVTLKQVCTSLYKYVDGKLISHSLLSKPYTKEELEKMAKEIAND